MCKKQVVGGGGEGVAGGGWWGVFFFNDPATTEIYTLSQHDALPISVSYLLFYSINPCGGRELYASL